MRDQHRYTRHLLVFSLLVSITCACGGEETDSPGSPALPDSSMSINGGTLGGAVDERDESSSRPSQGGEEASEETGEEASEETGEETGEETSEGQEYEWVDISLESLGLIPPTGQGDEIPPQGESICAYETPSFVLAHPLAQVGREAERRQYYWLGETESAYHREVAEIAHLDVITPHQSPRSQPKSEDFILPIHVNDLPLFPRAEEWSTGRCYELGPFDNDHQDSQRGGTLLNEAQAYEMYARLVQKTLWRVIDQTPKKRTVIGLRGSYPGSLKWHYNAPNQYNDSLVLMWRDERGAPHVREYPINTDTGVYDFGSDSSSSLRANRHYPYINGWHRDYNALKIDLSSYPVRDDTNNNGHWDSDRNGWLDGPEFGDDYDRLGSGHNIHAGNNNGPLSEALINIASAGCQVIPGMQNWINFISSAWTGLGDEVDYFLIDTRDISPRFWASCEDADGSHRCPYLIERFPYTHRGDTSLSQDRHYDLYNCSDADESGPERVYVMNLPRAGRLRVSIETDSDAIDPDIYLLDGDDPNACKSRDHRRLESWLPPGRYLIIVDTYVDSEGRELAGPYTLNIDWALGD